MRLQEYIKENEITLTKFAARCNISYGQLYRIFRQKPTTLENAIRIQYVTKNKVKAVDLIPKERMEQIKDEIRPYKHHIG